MAPDGAIFFAELFWGGNGVMELFFGDFGKVFGDAAFDDAGGVGAVGTGEPDREFTYIIGLFFEPGDLFHFEFERRGTGGLFFLEVFGHGLFEVVFYLLASKFAFAGAQNNSDGNAAGQQ